MEQKKYYSYWKTNCYKKPLHLQLINFLPKLITVKKNMMEIFQELELNFVHVCQATSVMSDSATLWTVDSSGKNTRVGCHVLFQGIVLT